jgi:hypothetical protein
MVDPQVVKFTSRARDLRTELLPRLRHQVFHVTSSDRRDRIIQAGAIRSNRDESFPFTYPQSRISYGRARGYVCLFDLRTATDDEVSHSLDCYYFLDPYSSDRVDPTFFLLDPAAYPKLIPCSVAKAARSEEMWIPHTEAWFPSDLPLHAVEKILDVEVDRGPEHPFVTALRVNTPEEGTA